jgi:hypothetical protein
LSGSDLQAIELRLAETGSELAPVIEAAQYARVIQPAEPDDPAEEQAMAGFVETLSDFAEAWESLSATERAMRLTGLSAQLEALERCGLFVHWGTVTRRFAVAGQGAVDLPLAIVTISRTGGPTLRILLPGELAVGSEGGGGITH